MLTYKRKNEIDSTTLPSFRVCRKIVAKYCLFQCLKKPGNNQNSHIVQVLYELDQLTKIDRLTWIRVHLLTHVKVQFVKIAYKKISSTCLFLKFLSTLRPADYLRVTWLQNLPLLLTTGAHGQFERPGSRGVKFHSVNKIVLPLILDYLNGTHMQKI